MKGLNIITALISANQVISAWLPVPRHVLPKLLMLGQWIMKNFKLTNDLQKSNMFVMCCVELVIMNKSAATMQCPWIGSIAMGGLFVFSGS